MPNLTARGDGRRGSTGARVRGRLVRWGMWWAGEVWGGEGALLNGQIRGIRQMAARF
jgi:hypothetical protein